MKIVIPLLCLQTKSNTLYFMLKSWQGMPCVSTYFHTLKKLASTNFSTIFTNSETFYLDPCFAILPKKVTKISICILKRLMYPKMAIFHAIPRLYLNYLISYLLFYPTFLYPS